MPMSLRAKELPGRATAWRDCYRVGAERFGWAARRPEPRSMHEDGMLLGMGMASACHTVYRQAAHARTTISGERHRTRLVWCIDRHRHRQRHVQLRQITADSLGAWDREGDRPDRRHWPARSTDAGGGFVDELTGLGSAGQAAARPADRGSSRWRRQARTAAWYGRSRNAMDLRHRRWTILRGEQSNPAKSITSILRRAGLTELSCDGRFDPGGSCSKVRSGDPEFDSKQGPRGMHSFGAIFAKVAVDPDLGLIRVRQLTGVYACGKIINPKLAESQLIGGITWGIGQALFEATHMDPRFGRFTNTNMAEYMIPVNLDVPTIDVTFLDDPDPFINPLGAKGVGEIGITGVTSAISDAVWHATGKRLRSTPILAEALLDD